MKVIHDLPPIATKEDSVSIDCEIYGAKVYNLHHGDEGQFASVQFSFDGETVYVITDQDKVAEAMKRVAPATHIFHNAKFDIAHLRSWCKYPDRDNLWDTMLMERILWSGYYDTFGLKDLARRYLNILVSKKEREEFATSDEMTREMMEYAALDASLTWKIQQAQAQEVSKANLKIYHEIDLPVTFAVLDFKGFRLDVDKWLKLADTKRKAADAIKAEFTINLNSPKQVLALLQSNGLTRLQSTGAEVLAAYHEHPLVSKILHYRELDKAASTYGEELVNKFVDKDGYIHANFNVSEAQTGRFSSTDPNLQNIPNTSEYRSCFIASEGCEIADMDYSAQEPRITASETEDKTLLDIIKSGRDIHTEVGKVVFKNPNMKKDDPKRKIAKTLNLGLSYGLTAAGLRNRVNQEKSDTDPEMSYDEAEAIVSDYFRQFYGVRQWIEAQRSSGQKLGYVETKSGRRMYINRYSYQWLNNAINSPIQGGAADCTKTALILFRKACKENKIPYSVVNVVHDEIVIDCPSVNMDTAYLHLEQSMITAGETIYKNVPFAVEKFRGKHWGIKH